MDLEYNTFLRDRYRIEKQLGKGGMGAVYLALDTVLQTKVAVKINQNPREEGREQFLQEARLLAGLRHPNLPRVIDYFVIEDSQYLVMDFVPGEDLGTIVKRDGKQDPDTVVSWAKQLGKALNYLHTQDPPVVHRDIKPGNIKITPRGEVILVDFGIAKSSDITQETSTGARGLTPGYSPPEQYGSGRTGHYSDQFGLAATLYNVLTNEKPVDAVERLLGQATLKPIHDLDPNIPPHLEEAIERALSIKPEDRYGSINEFILALGQSSIPGPDETMIAPAKTKQTTSAKPVGSPEATRVAIPSTPPSGPIPVAPSYPISQPIHQPKSKLLWLIPAILVLGAIVLFGGGWFVWNNFLANSETPPPATANVLIYTETSAVVLLPVEEATTTFTPEPTITDTPEPTPTDIPEPTIAPTQAFPSIGRDGLIAYVSNAEDGETYQLWTMKVYQQPDGTLFSGDQTQLTSNPGNKSYPNWSPDGSKIIFSAESGDIENKIDLFTVNFDGTGLSNIITLPGNETESAWSPDGEWIAFTTDNRSDGLKQLMIVRPDGTELRRLSSDKQEFSPEWSPKMDRLIYVLPSASLRYIWMRDPLNDFVDMERDMFFMRLKYVGDPAWSPDALWMAYSNFQGRTQDVYLTRILSFGLEVKRLTNTTFDSYPAWSPDSVWILFQSNRDANMELYIMDIEGQNQTNLTLSPDSSEMHPAWQQK